MERGSPCHTPLEMRNFLVANTLIRNEALEDGIHPLILKRHFSPKPICAITGSILFQFMESKALSKSPLNKKSFCFAFFDQLHTSLIIIGSFKIFLPSMKADSVSPIIEPITRFKHEARDLTIILLEHPMRLMGRNSLRERGSLF